MRGGFEIVYEITLTTRNIKRIVFTVSLVTLILVSVLTVFADNNTTNNTTNRSMAPQGFLVAVTVSPSTVYLGTLMPDGTQHDYPGIASVRVTGLNFLLTQIYTSGPAAPSSTQQIHQAPYP